jgi:hypothetical protein
LHGGPTGTASLLTNAGAVSSVVTGGTIVHTVFPHSGGTVPPTLHAQHYQQQLQPNMTRGTSDSSVVPTPSSSGTVDTAATLVPSVSSTIVTPVVLSSSTSSSSVENGSGHSSINSTASKRQ